MIYDYSLYFIGLMLVHLEHYLLDNGPRQFYLTVLKLYQMIVYLVIFLNVQMLQMNVGHFLLKVKWVYLFQSSNSNIYISSLEELSQAMTSFHNVLDDAWLGSSLIATSDDSLVVCNQNTLHKKNDNFL